eukprot:scaffold121633_cov57-Phaeocystis_antarctica.AAC.1
MGCACLVLQPLLRDEHEQDVGEGERQQHAVDEYADGGQRRVRGVVALPAAGHRVGHQEGAGGGVVGVDGLALQHLEGARDARVEVPARTIRGRVHYDGSAARSRRVAVHVDEEERGRQVGVAQRLEREVALRPPA